MIGMGGQNRPFSSDMTIPQNQDDIEIPGKRFEDQVPLNDDSKGLLWLEGW